MLISELRHNAGSFAEMESELAVREIQILLERVLLCQERMMQWTFRVLSEEKLSSLKVASVSLLSTYFILFYFCHCFSWGNLWVLNKVKTLDWFFRWLLKSSYPIALGFVWFKNYTKLWNELPYVEISLSSAL